MLEQAAFTETLLERKLNLELLLLCRRHAINNKYQYWLALAAIFVSAIPFVGLAYYFLEHGSVGSYPWGRAGALLVAVVAIAMAAHWLLQRCRNALNVEVRSACRDAKRFGYFIVKRSSQYHSEWYPYTFVLAVSRNFTPDDADDISDRLAKLDEYPDPDGLAGLLAGYDPPLLKLS